MVGNEDSDSETDTDISYNSESESDDGELQAKWTKRTVKEWQKRPEPHRSETLKELSRVIKVQVQDGATMEYVTLFAWASYQRQSQFSQAIRKLVALRCIHEKRGRDHYENVM